ncbi:hypothetical protein OESDEN_20762 [Oesophagostomum dentatum]|uniref:Leucine--tRNA ligase ubiquitin-like domain-containing protein n=1 Tax=Oesophagostomum dentatum TaxID=61180 RepID=A0A0B1S6S3_OESDE|nr:hypothetical protein OESDEN_20762 [Oesophagostomum dentatum]
MIDWVKDMNELIVKSKWPETQLADEFLGKVSLWRYQDPVGEDRKMISCLDPLAVHEQLEDDAVFAVDAKKKTVSDSNNGKAYPIGDIIVYGGP